MSDDNQLIQERREKLQALRAQAQANGTKDVSGFKFTTQPAGGTPGAALTTLWPLSADMGMVAVTLMPA